MKVRTLPDQTEALQFFKQIVEEAGLDYEYLYLFGSRAKNEIQNDSDWDFLVVLRNLSPEKSKKEIIVDLRIRFHKVFPLYPVDIIVKKLSIFQKEINQLNTLSYDAYHEGILI